MGSGGWVPGIAPSRHPPNCTTPGTTCRRHQLYRTCHTCGTAVLRSTKEILGVNNALRDLVLDLVLDLFLDLVLDLFLEPGYWSLEPGYWSLEPGYWSLDTDSWILYTGYWILIPGYCILDTGYWLLEACINGCMRVPGMVYIWRHFAVLTIIWVHSQNRDHLFLVREGWHYWKSWNSRS